MSKERQRSAQDRSWAEAETRVKPDAPNHAETGEFSSQVVREPLAVESRHGVGMDISARPEALLHITFIKLSSCPDWQIGHDMCRAS